MPGKTTMALLGRLVLSFALVVCVVSVTQVGAAFGQESDLYSATTFVTGQRAETRGPGVRAAFTSVLVKVSGQPDIVGGDDVKDYLGNAASYVARYSYRDRMEGIPHHDEQGSRDRPYDLTVHFIPAKIDEIIEGLGFRVWQRPRPTIMPLVEVAFQGRRFFVTSDGDEGAGQREALLAEADRLGLPLSLPTASRLKSGDVFRLDLERGPGALISTLESAVGSDAVLRGILSWDGDAFVWHSQWRIDSKASTARWSDRSETFDGAFRSGLGGSAAFLSRIR